jgi:hypothetical protein
MAQQAKASGFFLAKYLHDYERLHGMDDAELAKHLGCPPAALPALALCRAPSGDSSCFSSEVRQIAAYVGVTRSRLAQLIREVNAFGALGRQGTAEVDRGYLLAAREDSCDYGERRPDDPEEADSEQEE